MKMQFTTFNCFLLFALAISCSGSNSSGNDPDQPEKTVVCFIYHRFEDNRYPSTNVSQKDFESHLRYLNDHGFQVLNLSEALNYLNSGTPAQRTAVITVDDGYRSFYENGLPLLRRYKMPATLFINTGSVGSGDYMSWDQLQEVHEAKIEIGNHTHTHLKFLDMPEPARYKMFEEEIQRCQRIIKSKLGLTPSVFAYPYGEFDEGMKKVVEKMGFACAAAQYSGVMYVQTDRFRIPRFPMAEYYSDPERFAEKAMMLPLRITTESPQSTLFSHTQPNPQLTLTFDSDDLVVEQLQCFVQGGECEMSITRSENQVTVKMKSVLALSSQRRTLYTVTVPDKRGRWHWYSHLWINTEVR